MGIDSINNINENNESSYVNEYITIQWTIENIIWVTLDSDLKSLNMH